MIGLGMLGYGTYGAPLPVGEAFVTLLGRAGPTTFSLPVFIADLALTWAFFYPVIRWSGALGGVLAAVAPILATTAAFIADPRGGTAYLPFALRADDPLRALEHWVDLMLWSGAAAVIGWSVARARMRRGG